MTSATVGDPPDPSVGPGRERSQDRQLGFLWGGVALAILALSPLAGAIAARMMACPFKSLASIPCPTCGTGRAALALARFQFLEALVSFPLATAGWVVLIGGGLAAGLLALLGHGLPSLPRRLSWPWRLAVIGVLLLNWAYLIWTGA